MNKNRTLTREDYQSPRRLKQAGIEMDLTLSQADSLIEAAMTLQRRATAEYVAKQMKYLPENIEAHVAR
jgi:hypothetical protein